MQTREAHAPDSIATALGAHQPADCKAWFESSGLQVPEFDLLVKLIYSGILEPVPWTRFLDSLRERFEANYVALILRMPNAERPLQVVYAGQSQPVLAAPVFTDFVALDPFVNLPRNRMVTLEELIDEQTWRASSCYHEFYAPLDVRYHIAADIGMEGLEPDCRLRITRPSGASRFGERERALGNLLMPHLAIAVQLRASLDIAEVERHSYAGMLGRLSVGAVFLGRDGQILKMNPAASEILAQRDGLSASHGILTAAFPGENRELRRLIEQAVCAGGDGIPGVLSGMSISRTSGRANLGIAVRAAPPTEWSESSSRPAALVIIRDPQARVLASHEQLKRLYGLTAAEANLAMHLMRGSTVEAAAQSLQVSRNTVRCQIRAIFAKTGVTRQTDLLRVLLGGIAPLA